MMQLTYRDVIIFNEITEKHRASTDEDNSIDDDSEPCKHSRSNKAHQQVEDIHC